MIDYETYCQIRLLAEKGLKASQIAAELQLDIKTVEKWMDRESFQQRQSPKRSSKLDAFKSQIIALLDRHPYTAQQVFQQLQQQGYCGGYTILKDYVRRVRPVRNPAFLMLEFAAGECAQVDWGQYGSVPVGSTRRRLSFFLMVLCHSRMLYLEFTLSEAMDQFLTCHRHAFEFFGGVPEKIMIDNLKVGVVRHPAGQKALFNPRYLDFAAHYGFQPVACNIRKGNEKGRVENGVGYVKKNFLNGLEIPSFATLNPAAIQWRDTIANIRIHGETNQKPAALFEKEKPLLKALPVMPYDCGVIQPADVSRCCHIIFQSNRYSVPYLYASQRLTLKILPEQLLLFHHEKLVATHVRSYQRGQRISNPDHIKELQNQRQQSRNQTLLLAFLNLCAEAEGYCRKLQEKRLNAPHHIQKIIALSEIYGPDKVARAIQEALHFEAIGCEYIANILAQRENPSAIPGALHLTRRQDLLDLEIAAPDLSLYESKQNQAPPNP